MRGWHKSRILNDMGRHEGEQRESRKTGGAPRTYDAALARLEGKNRDFVRAIVEDGLSPSAAHRRAFGYVKGTALQQHLGDADVVYAFIARMRDITVSFTELVEDGKRVLKAHLCAEGVPDGIRAQAVRTLFDTLKRSEAGEKFLSDVAKAEDAATVALDDVAREVLGPRKIAS